MSRAQATAEEYVVDARRLEALRIAARNPEHPTIVMLHEGLGSVAHWRDFPFVLAEATGSAVFIYSRYGHGDSEPLGEPRSIAYMHHEAQVVLPQILWKAGIERPVVLGHSDGASIALIYAGIFPDSPASLILEAPHVFVEEITVASIAQARVDYKTTDMPQKLARYHANADSLFRGWNDIWLDPAFRAWNIESYLDRIRCPVLALQGAQDEYGTPEQIEAIRRRIPRAMAILFENCKHAPHRDCREATVAAIQRFLRTPHK